MKTSAVCPACGARLGFLSVVRAPTPFHLTCPACKAKLRVGLPGLWAMMAAVLSLFLLVAVLTYFGFRSYGWLFFYLGISALLVLWMMIEVSVALLFFNKATL